MNRRGFLTGAGTLSAAAAGGWTTMELGARAARAEGLAKAAGVSAGTNAKTARGAAPALAQSVTVGHLPGSAGLLEYAARGWTFPQLVTQMRWAAWEPGFSLPIFDSRVDVSLGLFQPAQVHAPSALLSLEVIAHFAIDKSPHFAPFNAWKYESLPGKAARRTSPLTFEAGVPDRVGLQVSYALNRGHTLSRLAAGGTVYLPIGGRNGAGTGIYVLATPSRVTGALPDFTEYTFTGDLIQPLRRDTGGTADFDFVALTIAPILS